MDLVLLITTWQSRRFSTSLVQPVSYQNGCKDTAEVGVEGLELGARTVPCSPPACAAGHCCCHLQPEEPHQTWSFHRSGFALPQGRGWAAVEPARQGGWCERIGQGCSSSHVRGQTMVLAFSTGARVRPSVTVPHSTSPQQTGPSLAPGLLLHRGTVVFTF